MVNAVQATGEAGWRKEYRYAVYERRLLREDGMSYSRSLIVLKNKYGVIVQFTRLHNYVTAYENKVICPLCSDVKAQLYYVCSMLNYILVDNFERFGFNHIFQIDKESLQRFFTDYALNEKPSGGHRGSQSIGKCIAAVTGFFSKLQIVFGGYMALRNDELYIEHTAYTKKGKLFKTYTPNFKVRSIPDKREVFRDIPTKVFKILLNLAVRYTPDVAFAIGLQAFAGLRPGEVCNVRQEHSPLGNGIVFTRVNGRLASAEINLTQEYVMRSDGVPCGKIKKERMQRVYTPFLDAFWSLYESHKVFLSLHKFEADYCPMFINRNGMAMTYDDYFNRFERLVQNHLRPALLQHSDPECHIYGQLLCENRLGPHALRHWFSVQLALRGEDIHQLQYWRGDRTPESAFIYLQNKGDMIRELKAANELLAEFLIKEGEKNVCG